MSVLTLVPTEPPKPKRWVDLKPAPKPVQLTLDMGDQLPLPGVKP